MRYPTSTIATIIIILCIIGYTPLSNAQKSVSLDVYQVSTTIGDCDGWPFGDSDPAWWWTGGDIDNQCVNTGCNGCTISTSQNLLDENYDCPTDMPASVSVRFRGCENDGADCAFGAFPGICDGNSADITSNITLPTANGTYNVGPICANSSGGCSGQWCYWATITVSGTFLSNGNDIACNAIDLGTLPFGGSLGDESNTTAYNNLCGTADSQPTNWTSNQGVWFTFQTGADVGTEITLELEPEGGPVPLFGDLDIQASIFEASPDCNSLIEVADGVDAVDVTYDETINFQCPQPNTTYYILVDGSSIVPLYSDEEGYFGLGLYDDGVNQAADYICDAEDLGTPSLGSPVTTNFATQSNICATSEMAAGVTEPYPSTDWSTDPNDQKGVWFRFTAPPSGSVLIDVESTADILNITQPHDLSVQVALYGTSNNSCTGTLEFIDDQESDLSPCGYLSVPINDLHDEDFKIRCLEPGRPYWILIDGDPAATLLGDGVDGYFSLTVSDLGQSPAPNDDVCNAIHLGAPLPGSPITLTDQNNLCASNFVEPNNFGWSNESGVWYSFVAPPSGAVEIWGENQFLYTCVPVAVPIPIYEDAIQIELAVFEAASGISCPPTCADPVACQNDENLTLVKAENEEVNDAIDGGIGPLDVFNDEYMFVECLTPGETYYILVDGYPTVLGTINTDFQEGIFDITIAAVDQPGPTGNDLPCDAIALGDPTGGSVGGTATTYNNYCADAADEAEPVGFDTEQTVWFSFEAPATGSVSVDVNEAGDDINLQTAVFLPSGSCSDPMVEIASNDAFTTWDVEIDEVHCLNPGETYYILVDGEHDATELLGWQEGEFNITVTEIPPLPVISPNNFICDAVDIGDPFSGGVGTTVTLTNENNLCANSVNDPTPTAFGPDYTVWFTINTPATPGTYAVEIYAESDFWSITDPFNFDFDAIDLQLAVFESSDNSCTGDLTEMNSSYIPVIDYPLSLGYDELLQVECLLPNSTYYLMVDGSTTFLGDIGNGQGNFDLTITSVTADPAAPNNDICDFIDLGQVPVGGNIPPSTDYYNFCADTEIDEPAPYGIDQTVWFTFTAPNTPGANASANITLDLDSDPNNIGDEIDLQVAVYEADDCTGTLNLLESDYDPGFYDEDVSLTCLVPGETYFVQVDGADNGFGGVEGYFTISVIDDGAGAFPTNDIACATAIPLGSVPDGGTLAPGTLFSNLCATIDDLEPDPGFGLGVDDIDQTVWFTFSPANSGNVTISAFSDGSDNIDLQLAAYYSADGTCDYGQFVPVDFEWDGGGAIWDESLTLTCLDPSTTYYLQVDGSSITEDLQHGNFTLEITDDAGSTNIPYNNDICDAHDFGVVNTSTNLPNETNICADLELGEPGVLDYAQHTVWYQFTASTSGRIDIEVDADDVFDLLPEIHLFSSSTGDCSGTLTQIEENDVPNPTNGIVTISTTCVQPGQTYFLQVDGLLLANQGDFSITLTNPEPNYGTGVAGDPEPSNNECIDAISLPVQSESCFIGDGVFQTENYGEPTISLNDAYVQGCNANNCGDTWYSFTMPSSGVALVEGNDDNGLFANDLTMVAYQGDCTTGLTALNCASNDEISYEIAATPGTTVYLQVFDGGLDYANEDFEICVSESCGADDCLNALVMEPNVAYCFNTATAFGEDLLAGDPGYGECATSAGGDPSPENSVYFSFLSDCNGGSITLSIFDVVYDDTDPNYQPCDGLFGLPTDGFTVTIFADDTPCDNDFDDQLWCLPINGCDEPIGPDSYEVTFDNLQNNTNYIIMIDGGIFNTLSGEVGGNVEGQIMITTLTNPDIDSMVVVDSIACYGGTGTLTAEVSGGAYPYSYNWDDGASFDSIYTNVGAGWHYVTVTADNSCEEVDSIFLPEPDTLISTIDLDESTVCYGENATANVSPTGGTTDYSFLWSNSETNATATMLAPGATYTVTVTDANNCTSTAEITVPDVDVGFIR